MFKATDVKELRDRTGAGMMDCKNALEASNGNMDDAINWLREKGISKAAKKESRIAAEGLTNIKIDGNKAIILEVNSETDFVAKNEEFKNFVSDLTDVLINSSVNTIEEALELTISLEKVSDKLIAITSKIGEKISFRRFEIIEKTDSQVFGDYMHMGGKIGVLSLLEGNNYEVAKDVAMHACAMKPIFIKSSDIPNEVMENERKVFKEQAVNEGKTPEIAEKMVEGRIKKYFKEVCLLEQPFIKDGDINVETYCKNNNSTVVNMIRYEVGEGIEKRQDDFAAEVQSQING
jgi:translation elongation factor Ts